MKQKIVEKPNPEGMWAVFVTRSGSKKSFFTVVHETEDRAKEEARRLAAKRVQETGPSDFRFFVCKIHGSCGIHEGKIVDTL